MELLRGDKLGRYEVDGRIAAGGMAEVYLARTLGHAGFAKTVALKRMLPQLAAEPGFRAMFMQEAAVAARLNHPHIVQIFDFAEERGELYLAMEFVHGVTLRQLSSAALFPPSGAARQLFPPVLAAHLCRCIARALAHAWQALDEEGRPLHLIHRDVSPHNILLSYEGDPKLADFGIARSAERRTSVGQLKGKLLYMSPEQLRGDTLDARSDVFALGIVLYETALALRRPLFDAGTEEGVKEAVLTRLIPPPTRLDPAIPASLAAVLLKALERDPCQRFQSAAELADALGEVVHREAKGPQDWDLAAFMRRVYGEPPPLLHRASCCECAVAVDVQPVSALAVRGDDPRAETLSPREAAAVREGGGAPRKAGVTPSRVGGWRARAVLIGVLAVALATLVLGGGWAARDGSPVSSEAREAVDERRAAAAPTESSSLPAQVLPPGAAGTSGPPASSSSGVPQPRAGSSGVRPSPTPGVEPAAPKVAAATLPSAAEVPSAAVAVGERRPTTSVLPASTGAGAGRSALAAVPAPNPKRAMGTLSVHLKPWGFVWLEGEKFTGARGQEAAPLLRRRVPIGRHRVHVQDPEGRRRDVTVVISPDRESRVEGPFDALTVRP